MPTTPPTMQRVTASRVNCSRMFFFVAPIALRIPISRVRSVTLDQHDIHHAHAADHQAHGRNRNHEQKKPAGELIP